MFNNAKEMPFKRTETGFTGHFFDISTYLHIKQESGLK